MTHRVLLHKVLPTTSTSMCTSTLELWWRRQAQQATGADCATAQQSNPNISSPGPSEAPAAMLQRPAPLPVLFLLQKTCPPLEPLPSPQQQLPMPLPLLPPAGLS